MTKRAALRVGMMAAGLAALSACTTPADVAVTPVIPQQVARPIVRTPQPAPAPETVPPISAESAALKVYYQRLQNDLITQGLLRSDGGGSDTPFTDTMLARNFVRIALFDEYVTDGDFLRAQATESRLRR